MLIEGSITLLLYTVTKNMPVKQYPVRNKTKAIYTMWLGKNMKKLLVCISSAVSLITSSLDYAILYWY